MRGLSASDLLRVWERGQGQHPLNRALLLLSVACPEISFEALTELPIGRRDALLLTLREITFGSTLCGFAECPRCSERLEFTMQAADIRAAGQTSTDQDLALTAEGYALRFRLPNSLDLAVAAGCPDARSARSLLVERCVTCIRKEGSPVSAQELPEEVLEQLAGRMAELDSQAEVLLDMECPACRYRWQVTFDIASFFWTEICAQAKRLLREVHTLAKAYGWREADILSMSAIRRQSYLEMAT